MLDHNQAVIVIKAMKGARSLTDADLSRKVGLPRNIINLYLNRRIDLLPADVERLIKALGLESTWARLTTGTEFQTQL